MPEAPRPTPMLRLHHAGDWSADAVSTVWVPSTYAAPPEVERLVDDVWARAMLEPNRKLFDGPMCRLESWDVAGGRVRCGLSRTTYRAFWGSNIMHPELADRYGPAVMANPVGVSPALETADGFLLFGKRNAAVAYYPDRVHPFAGCLEPGDAAADEGPGPDLFAAVRRELEEEVRIGDGDVELIRLTGVVEDVRLRQPELIFRVRTRLPRARVEAQIERDEHHGSVAVAATEAGVAAAAKDPAMTPIGVASLLLWGRVAFGEGWFRRAAVGTGLESTVGN